MHAQQLLWWRVMGKVLKRQIVVERWEGRDV